MKWPAMVLLWSLVQGCSPASLLVVVSTLSVSHFAVFEPLLSALVSRGHNLTLISGYPLAGLVHEHLDLRPAKRAFNGSWSLDSFPTIPPGFRTVLSITADQVRENQHVFELDSVQRLLVSERTFDLIIVEQFISDVFLAIVQKFQAPYVTVSACPPMPWAMDRFGAPNSVAFSPNLFSGFGARMGFLQRLTNFLQVLYAKVYQKLVLNSNSEQILKKYVPNGNRLLEKTVRNASLLLLNSHWSLFSARPLPPQVIEVGGLHVKQPASLTEAGDTELDRWMNESTHGVVYFSFGSMLRGATLPADKVEAFVDVFRTLKQRVLWKWEEDTVEDLPANVKIMKWLPQRDVLAHPKVKVFISHGGLLGTTEAVVSSVPILGIPMYGDQPNNVAALVEQGVAVHVPYNDIRVDTLTNALNALLYDQSFSENARQLSRRFLDRPQSALDTAVYWTEYVIRHRGAPHLQSAAVHMPWYQLWLLDVVTVLLVGLSLTVTILYYLLRTVFRLIFCRNVTSNTKLKRS